MNLNCWQCKHYETHFKEEPCKSCKDDNNIKTNFELWDGGTSFDLK